VPSRFSPGNGGGRDAGA